MATATKPNPIKELRQIGQSLWLDNIRRQLITSGELARLRDEGLTGVTSNPTIFEKAVSGSTDYDEAMVELVRAKTRPKDMLWDLMVEDVQSAADVFRPVYDRTQGADGFVSIEVGPTIANSTQETIDFAQYLHDRCRRPNVMVKIPATKAGLPAIEQQISKGNNINITLIFSVDRYAEVVEAYMSGLERLHRAGGDLSKVASVASFFVSRVDTKVDKILAEKINATTDPRQKQSLERLYGKAAIANSKDAYERFGQMFSGPRWEKLKKAGARTQRPLWASTSTKDPRYPDTYYVEELIGPDTVDTVPPQTLAAFREHGEVRRSVDENVELAHRQLQQLAEVGVDLDKVTYELEVEGVEAFVKSFESLIATLAKAAKDIKAGKGPRQWHSLGRLQPGVDQQLARLQKEDAPRRLWAKDSTLWTADPAKRQEIHDRLGWLDVADKMQEKLHQFAALNKDGKGYTDVVLLGMGGSSLCPDVLRNTFGAIKGHPRLHVLDTTDPSTILAVRSKIKVPSSLFVVASKSGETTETLSHFAYFWEQAKGKGRQFAAITDPGTSLEKLAQDHGFRWVFPNPPDIGGRYSALSYFGLVPGALMGLDVAKMLDRAIEMEHSCADSVPVESNPGVWLGGVMGKLATAGRNKLTLIMSPKVATFGYWVEQLLAESTGKEGKGIVPIEGEPLGKPAVYGDDRLFVHVRMDADPPNRAVQALERAGHPVVTLTMRDKYDLGGEFFRWEVATAVAGSILGIDAFDQPNVQESKDNTKEVLASFKQKGKLPAVESVAASRSRTGLKDLIGKARKGAYFAIMAYTARTPASEAAIAAMRRSVRDKTQIATTAGYGPRFLHSTGQLHKGGPKTGLFLQIVQDDTKDVPIPGQPYSFSVLKQAQAIGDLKSLTSRRLPVLRVTLGREPAAGWRALAAAVKAAVR
ncbi:MAG TPA: bifunctional transaldolase/phosoglucose isomerase, partial [Candidatus Dormibacteraeota bacterium]|nr:bifunctional transaldolase/phosoglucose isomerase [Candidatus Dormibacteraeota bacterium]